MGTWIEFNNEVMGISAGLGIGSTNVTWCRTTTD